MSKVVEMVHKLIYRSRAIRPPTDGELLWLLNPARVENARMGLTGMLLYRDGLYLQLLEGGLRELERVYGKIEKDPRHTSVTLLGTDYGERHFPHWTMGFKNLRDWRVNDPALGVSDLMSVPFDALYFGESPSRAQAMLLCFRGLSK